MNITKKNLNNLKNKFLEIHQQKKHNEKQSNLVGSFKRSIAGAIDSVIVLIGRIFFAETFGKNYLEPSILSFKNEFKEKFGTDTPKNTPEHLEFLYQHEVFSKTMILMFMILMIGAIYHAYLNSSSWQGTIGKRTMGFTIIKQNNLPLSFFRALLHYFLSILPFIYIFYLFSYQLKYNIDLYQAITANEINILFGIIFTLWVQIHAFTKNKTTAYDLICNTICIYNITNAKMPWSKIKKS
ncbi:hypothetical protein LBMAG18_02870 [Alphaproteobacteria bacterium]|nr:hypothetical protein LBMAG18_02870 [Alphaproteobacteria bacterium]